MMRRRPPRTAHAELIQGGTVMARLRFLLSALVAAAMLSPVAAPASPSGLAWDSVTKFVQGTDPTAVKPGTFDADYAQASSVRTASGGGGGFLGKIKQMQAMGNNLGQMMKYGFAEKHYIAGSKERTDQVAAQTATILDCSARTLTTLDLAKKTYTVVSLDQPSSGGGSSSGGGKPAPRATDDGTKVAIVVTNTSLGAERVAGQSTNGFRSDTQITETKASGESNTTNADIVGYYTGYAHPYLNCSNGRGASTAGAGQGFAMMANYAHMMQMFSQAGLGNRFSIKQTGPAMPLGKFSM